MRVGVFKEEVIEVLYANELCLISENNSSSGLDDSNSCNLQISESENVKNSVSIDNIKPTELFVF
ncbi:hypothetical protein T265_08352 [Opisthorchis viverrini]|uniref:Uncharacterized protein n=1 Tax=Opisthorchis viverrini TaxID=6198 RepID=A0A074Z9D2_OPIVI|nr:hypothetical protein T265_08352 [Opisthorchis viverrini]KER23846.1 hypothetical protein T265_08352 [Opisthorchis viverrini]